MKQLILAALLSFSSLSCGQVKFDQGKSENMAGAIYLTPQNSLNLRTEIDGDSITAVQLKIAELVKNRKDNEPIYLVLDTPGGSITAGETLIQYLKTVPNLHTITIFAASMGSAVVEALPGKRYITEDGVLMFHRARVQLSGQVEDGELESRLANVKRLVQGMELRNAKRMSMSLQDYKAAVVNEYWLDAAQSVENKAADSIATVICSPELIDAREQVTVQSFFGAISFEFSACPLIRFPLPSKAAAGE